ncbi:hypothetical protein SAMN06265795_11398 [Noviherbaspirillum humi]|uniref:VanZ like family protein n=1 Tax=Noviherbaspirillum humi TaxID=1688639 RepID=A0A239JT29_9BURK|nr:VanZ family protein [Noviherbaspirillum humi]SNT09041.1 hypothetical protein SAMN06265795_11398 [Noviherbaspirillum humi]
MYRHLIALLWEDRYATLRVLASHLLFVLILIAGNLPGARKEVGEVASGFVLHLSAYSVISYLLFTGTRGAVSRRAAVTVLTVVAMGALDEFVQSYFPYRGASVWDWLVDVAASLVTCTALWTYWPKVRKKPAC